MKRKICLTILLGLISIISYSQVNPNSKYQRGYVKKNGTYVQPHYKTVSNKTNKDNYSTKPNTNTYTNQKGRKAKDYTPEAKNYGSGKPIYTGSKGGQYYINDKGKKIMCRNDNV